MLVADLAQTLEIALGRHQHAGRARDRLNEASGDGAGAVEIDKALKFWVGTESFFGGILTADGTFGCVHRQSNVAGQRADVAAKQFFVGTLKPIVDEYLKKKCGGKI